MKRSGASARRSSWGGAALACASLVGASVPEPARAAPPPAAAPRASIGSDPAAAEALFERARRLADAGQLEAACPLFAESNRLDPGVGVLLYLAACQESAGRLATAWATFRDARGAAAARGQVDRVAVAEERLAALAPRVPRIRLVVPPVAEEQGWIVRRDDLVLGPSQWDTEIPVDPGERRIEVLAPGFKPFATTILVAEGAVTRVELPLLAPDAQPLSLSTERADVAAADASWTPMHTTAVVVGSVGVIGLAVGTGFGVAAASQWSEANDHCRRDTTPWRCDDRGLDAADATDTSAAISTTAFAVGGAAVVAGIVLWLAAPDQDDPSPRMGLAAGPGDAGIAVARAF